MTVWFCIGCLVMLFGQDARSSKSNFIGCFDPTCHVTSVVEGTCDSTFYTGMFLKHDSCKIQ